MDIKKEDQKEINKINLDEEISESGEGSNPSSMENSENEDKQIEALLEENKKLNDLFLRSKAELDNFKASVSNLAVISTIGITLS